MGLHKSNKLGNTGKQFYQVIQTKAFFYDSWKGRRRIGENETGSIYPETNTPTFN